MRKSVTISEFYRTWGKGQIGTDERLREEQSSPDERLREEQSGTDERLREEQRDTA